MDMGLVDRGFAALQDIYDTLVDLRTFVQINHSGFRKIVKKVSDWNLCVGSSK